MPRPRTRRPRPEVADDDPAELAAAHAELDVRLAQLRWTIECHREATRRVVSWSPPNGPWIMPRGLTASISRDRIHAGETPPEDLPPDWRPPETDLPAPPVRPAPRWGPARPPPASSFRHPPASRGAARTGG